jgi:hypothetical protein
LASKLCQIIGDELFFTWHMFLEVGKTQNFPSKIWQTLGDALRWRTVGEGFFCFCLKK